MVTLDDIRAVVGDLPRSYEVVVRGRRMVVPKRLGAEVALTRS